MVSLESLKIRLKEKLYIYKIFKIRRIRLEHKADKMNE